MMKQSLREILDNIFIFALRDIFEDVMKENSHVKLMRNVTEKHIGDYLNEKVLSEREIEEELHNAGLNAFTHPVSQSSGEWRVYRKAIAKAIHEAQKKRMEE